MTTGLVSIGRGAIAAAFFGCASLLTTMPASAGDIATRCGAYGCEAIHCNDTGDRCYRVSGYGGYGEGRYYRSGYRAYGGDGDYEGLHTVCDSDGDRCYRSDEPYWNYREYYRRHGYRWSHGYRSYGYHGGEYRETDRLNRDEYERSRYADRDDSYDRDDDRYDWRR